MFGPITIPYGAKMLFNTLKLKPGASMDDVELALGEMCDAVRSTCGGDKGGFLAGQAFRFSGFVSVGVPVINQHNGVQSKPDYRVLTGIGARLN